MREILGYTLFFIALIYLFIHHKLMKNIKAEYQKDLDEIKNSFYKSFNPKYYTKKGIKYYYIFLILWIIQFFLFIPFLYFWFYHKK